MTKHSNTCKFGLMTYLSRSGSTLLSRVLNECHSVCVTLEANLPAEFFGIHRYRLPVFGDVEFLSKYLDLVYGSSRLATWEISKDEILDSIDSEEYPADAGEVLRILLRLYRDRHKPGSEVVIYKGSPVMPWDLPQFMNNFPDFAALHVIRDPRGVYNSQRHSIDPYRNRYFTDSLAKTANQWKKAVRGTIGIREEKFIEIKYEALLENHNDIRNRILSFLSVPPGTGLSDNTFSKKLPQAERQIHRLVDLAPDKTRVAAWRTQLATSEIEWLEAYLSDLMAIKGYVCSKRPTHSRRLLCKFQAGAHVSLTNTKRLMRAGIRLVRRDPRYLNKIRFLWSGKRNG